MKKIANKKTIIIVLCVLIVVLSLCLLKGYTTKKQEETIKQYTNIKDFKTVEEVLIYKDCKYIRQVNSKTEGYEIDIYTEFKYDLFTGKESNKVFFDNLIGMVANVLNNRNFILIDNSKNIVIQVSCNKEEKTIDRVIINGEINYFEKQETKNSINNYKAIQTTNVTINSLELKKVIDGNWQTSKINLGTQESIFNKYDIYFDEGIEIRSVYKKIFNLVFTANYKNNVINEIKVGTNFETIKKSLGEPAFETTKLLGYKTKEFYIFFLENEISIYRVEQYNTEQFGEWIKSFDESAIRKSVSNLTDIWPDYDKYENNENYIEIVYSLKGVKVQFNVTSEQGVVIYNNYTGKILDKTIFELKETELPEIVYMKLDEDLVYKSEIERIATKEHYSYVYSLELQEMENKENKISKNYIYVISLDSAKFISKDGKNANSELNESIDTYLWLNDDIFAFSVSGKGIYLYNVANRKKIKVIEGKEKFEIKEYKNNILKYDEEQIKINL